MFLWLRIVAVVFVALSMGASFAHVLELPAKLELGGEHYLAVQVIYRFFGSVATVLELGSFLLLLAVTIWGWQRLPAHLMALVATIVFVASVVTWAAVVSPMNSAFTSWTGRVPADWTAARDRWEWGHVTVFSMKLVAFVLLLRAVVR
jgi:hypothetical protein